MAGYSYTANIGADEEFVTVSEHPTTAIESSYENKEVNVSFDSMNMHRMRQAEIPIDESSDNSSTEAIANVEILQLLNIDTEIDEVALRACNAASAARTAADSGYSVSNYAIYAAGFGLENLQIALSHSSESKSERSVKFFTDLSREYRGAADRASSGLEDFRAAVIAAEAAADIAEKASKELLEVAQEDTLPDVIKAKISFAEDSGSEALNKALFSATLEYDYLLPIIKCLTEIGDPKFREVFPSLGEPPIGFYRKRKRLIWFISAIFILIVGCIMLLCIKSFKLEYKGNEALVVFAYIVTCGPIPVLLYCIAWYIKLQKKLSEKETHKIVLRIVRDRITDLDNYFAIFGGGRVVEQRFVGVVQDV